MRAQGGIVRLLQRSRTCLRREAVSPVQLLQHRAKSSLANVDLDDIMSTTPLPPSPPPPSPKGGEGPQPTSQLIKYDQSHSGPSLDRMAFDQGDDLSGPISLSENTPGIEAGRLVEVRRNNLATLGLILCSVMLNNRPRILLMRGTGEIWVAGSNDIQFVMPASLVPASLAAECWSPELIQLWSSGQDIGMSDPNDEEALIGAEKAAVMLRARRKIGTIMRRVQREAERMTTTLARGGLAAGVGGWTESVWEHYAPKDDRSKGNTISSAEVAELLLNKAANGKCDPTSPDYIAVRPNTLPAFGAHTMLMERGDLFLAEERNMWNNGTFFVRPREDRERLQVVWRWVNEMHPIFTDFVAKATKVRGLLAAGKADEVPEWTEDELDILHVMTLSFLENRTTQTQPSDPIVASILKTFGEVDDVEGITTAKTESLLRDIGMLAPGDSHRLGLLTERVKRDMAGVNLPVVTPEARAQPTAEDAALDSLRSDSGDRIFVIDDMSAKELDDGIALERISDSDNEFWIHTYVADPTRYVSMNDPTGTHAFYQGATQYTGDGTIPLLPSQLGGGLLSLGTNKDGQAAVKLSTRVDREGNILDHKVGLSFIRNACLTTYSTVNEALNLASPRTTYPFGRIKDEYAQRVTRPTAKLVESDIADLKTLHELASKLRAKRFATAGFELTNPSVSTGAINGGGVQLEFFDRAGLHRKPQSYGNGMLFHYAVTENGGPNTSERMVSEFMVLANRAAAYFCHSRNLAAVFRTVGTVKNSSVTPPGFTRDELLAKRLPGTGDLPWELLDRAKLIQGTLEQRTTPGPNWIMGFDRGDDHGYLRATSPLRRFDDMLAHWQIKRQLAIEAGLTGVPAPLDHATVTTMETRTRKAELRIRNIDARTREYWTASVYRARMDGLSSYDADPNAHAYEYPDGKIDVTDLTAHIIETQRKVSWCPHGAMDAVVPELGTTMVVIGLSKHHNPADFATGQEVKARVSNVITMPNARITLELH